MLKGWSWKAILGGVAICFLGPRILWYLILVFWLLLLTFLGVPYPWKSPSFTTSTIFYGLSIFCGVVTWWLAGYATAAWAPKRKIFHTVIVVILAIASNSQAASGSDSPPLWVRAGSLFMTLTPVLAAWRRVKTHGAESQVKPKSDSSSGLPPIASPL
jgi:hypothetical protein